MRIATSTIYDAQASSIDNLVAQQQQLGQSLSSGKQLNAPSDNPTQIAQDLALRSSIAAENQASSNITSATSQLTTVDGALSTLTNIMQKARGIAVEAAAGFTNNTQRQALGSQVDTLLGEAISIANTKYAGKYVFAGTAGPYTQPVTANGQPVSSVSFNGNSNGQTEQLYGGETVNTSVTLQQAFNYNSTDGSPDVFQTLITLRDTIEKNTVTSQSATRVNSVNTSLTPATAINAPGILATPLAPDGSGNTNILITSAQTGSAGVTITIPAGSTMGAVLAAINGASGATGVTASFDYKQQRLALSCASGPFQIGDAPTVPGGSQGNFVQAFGLQSQADLTTDVSRQLGDVDRVMQSLLTTRSTLGGSIQTLSALGAATDSQVVNDTKVQSGIEDADIAKVISQFSQTQTALQAAYGTTTRLESKTLFDYLQ
ncbi:MAG TPA: flagellin hook IN motif-containing protein [Candidatus Baltobacteraceae bacterium]|nr:flagellin hook IN motif-containing protein [Candidatus Baltobacteraceae bacterium]